MAKKGNNFRGNDFKPGNPGGPGRPPLPPELKAAKRLTKTEFERIANQYLFATDAELEKAEQNSETPAIERLVISILRRGNKDGDHARAEWLLQRLLGKVTDKVEVSQPKPFVIERSDGSQLVLGAKVEKEDE
jgi:hypothetical protein